MSGYRFHDTEDDGTENQHSDSFHLAGTFSDDGIRHEFCMKTDDVGHKRYNTHALAFSVWVVVVVVVFLLLFFGGGRGELK